jgi:hypothetical protein
MTFEEDVDADETPCELAGRISCEWGSGSGGFPSFVVSGGEDDCNAAKVMITFAAIMSEDMISVDEFVEYISFEPGFLDKVDVESFCFHHGNEVFVSCIVV